MSLKAESDWYKIYDLGMDPAVFLEPFKNIANEDDSFDINIDRVAEHKAWVIDDRPDIWEYINNIHPLTDLWTTVRSGLVKQGFVYWIMPETGSLQPHLDAKTNDGTDAHGFVIVPLVGETITKSYGRPPYINPHSDGTTPKNNDTFTLTYDWNDYTVIDQVTYGPGDVVILNNTNYIHSVHPQSARVALQFSAASW